MVDFFRRMDFLKAILSRGEFPRRPTNLAIICLTSEFQYLEQRPLWVFFSIYFIHSCFGAHFQTNLINLAFCSPPDLSHLKQLRMSRHSRQNWVISDSIYHWWPTHDYLWARSTLLTFDHFRQVSRRQMVRNWATLASHHYFFIFNFQQLILRSQLTTATLQRCHLLAKLNSTGHLAAQDWSLSNSLVITTKDPRMAACHCTQ